MFSTTLSNINKFMTGFIETNADEEVLEQWNDKSNQRKLKAVGNKVKKQKDPNAPKGKLNAYMFFCKDMRSTVISENPEMKPKEILQELGARWNNIKETSAARKYNKMASDDKIRYDAEMAEYKREEENKDDEEEKPDDLNKKNITELRAMCDKLRIPHSQLKKKELIEILNRHEGAGAKDEHVNYSSLSLNELKDVAKTKGVSIKGKKTKVQIIAALEAHSEESSSSSSDESSSSSSSSSSSDSESEEEKKVDLSKLSKQDLVSMCKDKGIATNGKNRAALIIALEQDDE